MLYLRFASSPACAIYEPAPLLRRSLLPPSDTELLVTGLNLLRLLVQNRIAEFHTELELLPQQVLVISSLARGLHACEASYEVLEPSMIAQERTSHT